MDVLRVVRKTGDRDAYGLAFRQRREMLSSVLTRDVQTVPGTDESGWDAETLRRESRGEG